MSFFKNKATRLVTALMAAMFASTAYAADLADIQARGELRHIGIPYANFVTGAGDGFDVELMQGFAQKIGVKYKLVYSDFYNVVRDLLGKDVVRNDAGVSLTGEFPVKGDVISTGFTRLPWREAVLLFSEPTFPSQVLLVAPADSAVHPIPGSDDLAADIKATKALIGDHSLLVMDRTCLAPDNYGLRNAGYDLRAYTKSTNLNEMAPAMLAGQAELTLLDVPDAILDLKRWGGKIKIVGPISEEQILASAFPKDAPHLRDAFNEYLHGIKANGTYDRLVDKYYPGIREYFQDYFDKRN